MKIVLAIVLTVWFVSAGGAQGNPVPGQPVQPVTTTPVQPAAATPAQPAITTPAQPAAVAPQPPVVAGTTGTASDFFRSTYTIAPALGVSTGIQSGFRPFHKPDIEPVVSTAPSVSRQMKPLEELRKKQTNEIKALTESLKGKPQAEINKAVEAKKVEQSAAIEALQNANKGKGHRPKKRRPEPAQNKIKARHID